jgi:hypothetical protein
MLLKTYWPAALLILLASCNLDEKNTHKHTTSGDGTSTSRDTPAVKLVPIGPQDKPEAGQYCYIKKVYNKDGVTYIDADFIQFLMGDDAFKAAKKRGDAVPEVHDGDTTWLFESAYYVVNENAKIRSLPLAANFEFDAIEGFNAAVGKSSAADYLASLIKNNIFILTINKEGIVTLVKEQYLD